MESTRIYKVLKLLSIPQLNRFLKFIKSPYHNVNVSIERLAVYIIEYLKDNKKLEDKEIIWRGLAAKKEFSDLRFRKLCNDLLERLEKFLILENLERNQIQQSNLLLDSIRKNRYEILAEKHISKSSKEISREIDQSSDYYLQRYFYEKTIQNLKSNYEKKVDLKKGKLRSYDQLSKNLDAFYVIEKLRLATDLQTWKKMYKSDESIDLGVSLNILDQYQFDNIPSVEIYRSMYNLYKDESDTESYFKLKEKAQHNINSFPKDEQREIFDVLVSYCIKWVNKGDMDFHKETLLIYDWGIDQEITLNKGKLSPTSFRNYVVIGLRVGEFDKVEEFIKTNSLLLNDEHKENAVNFNLARVSFYRKNFNEVLEYLNQVNYEDIWYNVNSRTLLLATYYELHEWDTLDSNIDTFSTFLRRERSLGDAKRKSYKSFVNYLKKLQNSSYKRSKLLDLQQKIIADKNVTTKQWLLEKIEESIMRK